MFFRGQGPNVLWGTFLDLSEVCSNHCDRRLLRGLRISLNLRCTGALAKGRGASRQGNVLDGDALGHQQAEFLAAQSGLGVPEGISWLRELLDVDRQGPNQQPRAPSDDLHDNG